MYFNAADWAVIFLYLVGIVALGVWFGKDQRTTRDYFLGSRNVAWWGIGLSIVAAETSALTIIGVPALAYGGDISLIQIIIGYVIARIILAIVMVPHYFKGEIYSPYQLFANNLGQSARKTAGAFFLVSETLAAGVRVYVVSIPIQLMLGIGALDAILIFIILSLIYTYIGGVKAVIWTDAVQFALFLLGGIFTLVYIPSIMEGGLNGVIAKAAAGGKLHWLNTHLDILANDGIIAFLKAILGGKFNIWMGLIGGTVMVMSSHGAEQLIVQRVLVCKNVSDGRKALILSAVFVFPLFLIFLLAGAMLWVYYQSHPFKIPLPDQTGMAGMKKTDFVFPIFMITETPHILRGFLIVAILSAAMSSVSSALTSLASVSTMDFIKHYVRERTEDFYFKFSKYSTLFWAGMLILIAWLSREVKFVFNTAFSLRGLTSGALLGGLLLAVFKPKTGAKPVIIGMLISLVFMILIQTLPSFNLTKEWWQTVFGQEILWPWYTLIGMAITIGSSILVSKILSKDKSKDRK
ncbi:MAG: sodium:solute symporter family transporter [Verrucomicrobiia bacterium]